MVSLYKPCKMYAHFDNRALPTFRNVRKCENQSPNAKKNVSVTAFWRDFDLLTNSDFRKTLLRSKNLILITDSYRNRSFIIKGWIPGAKFDRKIDILEF